jgi:hypothetical protein
MAKSPEEMAASMIANMKEKTGKTLEQWLKITKKEALEKHGQIVKFLKEKHQVSHGFANLIAHKTLASDAGSAASADLVAAQYSGKKAGLKPIYDAVIKTVESFGGDVEVSPKKTYVSLRRKKQFAIVQPSTAARVDIGINLPDTAATDRLEASGSFNAMVSHRVRVTDAKGVNAELKKWLKAAYQAAG